MRPILSSAGPSLGLGDCLVLVLTVLLWLGVCAQPSPARAHARSASYSSWEIAQRDTSSWDASVRLRIPLLELSRLGIVQAGVPDSEAALAYLRARLELSAGAVPCAVVGRPVALSSPAGWVHYEWRVECASADRLSLRSELFLDVAPGHLHFARIGQSDGGVLERVLTEGESDWAIGDSFAAGKGATAEGGGAATTGQEGGTGLVGYIALGIEHILSGWDHLAFVIALLLLAGSLGEVARLVTGFTVAHSVTLGLAVLGLLEPEASAVEALIGFSIALVAAENGWLLAGRQLVVPLVVVAGTLVMALLAGMGFGNISSLTLAGLALFTACHFLLLERVGRPARLRVAVAFAFGLVHGFGFAGVLGEMSLPTDRLVPALFGFNLGVEIGQLAVVIVAWPALRQLERSVSRSAHRLVAELSSAAICGLGLFWFVERAYG